MDIVHKTFLIKDESKDSCSRDDLTSYLAATGAIASQSNEIHFYCYNMNIIATCSSIVEDFQSKYK